MVGGVATRVVWRSLLCSFYRVMYVAVRCGNAASCGVNRCGAVSVCRCVVLLHVVCCGVVWPVVVRCGVPCRLAVLYNV